MDIPYDKLADQARAGLHSTLWRAIKKRVRPDLEEYRWAMYLPDAERGIRLMSEVEIMSAIKHPHSSYTLLDAVDLCVNHAKTSSNLPPSTFEGARDYIERMRTDLPWLETECALDLFDAVIDGRDLRTDCRIVAIVS